MKVFPEKTFVKKTGRIVQGFYMDGILKDNIDKYYIRAVKNDYDGISIISGMEGTGKTSLACSLAFYCDPTFPMDASRIVFNARQIHQAIDKADPGQSIVIDEAILSMGSQDAASDIQKVLIKKFTTIRKKNLFIFIIIPSFFMLRKYFAIFRTRFLIHCYTPDGVKRGYWKLYNRKTKRQLYIRGMKEMDMGVVRADWYGNFTDTYGFFFDKVLYEKKKDEAIASIDVDPEIQLKADYKAKFDKAVATLKEYQLNLRLKYHSMFKQEKDKFKDNVKKLRLNNVQDLNGLKSDLAKIRSGKRDGELIELIDFRDKMLWHLYHDQMPIEIVEDLREKKLLKLLPQACVKYLERGKSLMDFESGVNKYKEVVLEEEQTASGG